MIARHCIAQKRIHYYCTKLNGGQSKFEPGDQIFVRVEDYPKLKRKNQVKAVEEEAVDIAVPEINFLDYFPKRSRKIWVFGDGPSSLTAREKVSEDVVVFAVNRCFLPKLNLTPTYYVAIDDEMYVEQQDQLKDLPTVRKFAKRGAANVSKFDWQDLRFFDVLGETGFSTEAGEVYHGKTSTYIALQLAVQCGKDYIGKGLEIHLAGVDLAILTDGNQRMTHHYGHGNYHETLFTRMLQAFRYGLNYLNEIGVKWVNHSPLLQSRIADLELVSDNTCMGSTA